MSDIKGAVGGGPSGSVTGLSATQPVQVQKGIEDVLISEGLKVAAVAGIREANKRRVLGVAEARAEIANGESTFENVLGEEQEKWYSPIYTSARLEGARQSQALAMFTRAQKDSEDAVYENRALDINQYQTVLSEGYKKYLTGDEETDEMFLNAVQGGRNKLIKEQGKAHAVYAQDMEAVATIDLAGGLAGSISDSDDPEQIELVSGRIASLITSKLNDKGNPNPQLEKQLVGFVSKSVFSGDSVVYDSLMKSIDLPPEIRADLIKAKELANDIKFQRQSDEYAMALGNFKGKVDALIKDPSKGLEEVFDTLKEGEETLGIGRDFYEKTARAAYGKDLVGQNADAEIAKQERKVAYEYGLRNLLFTVEEMDAGFQLMIDSEIYADPKDLKVGRKLLQVAKLDVLDMEYGKRVDWQISRLEQAAKRMEQKDVGAAINGLIVNLPPKYQKRVNTLGRKLSKNINDINRLKSARAVEIEVEKILNNPEASSQEVNDALIKVSDSGFFTNDEKMVLNEKVQDRFLTNEEQEEKRVQAEIVESRKAKLGDYVLPSEVYVAKNKELIKSGKLPQTMNDELQAMIDERSKRDIKLSGIIGKAMNGRFPYVEKKDLEDLHEKVSGMNFDDKKDAVKLIARLPPSPSVVRRVNMSSFSMSQSTPPSDALLKDLELIKMVQDEGGRKAALRYFDGNEVMGGLFLGELKDSEPKEAYFSVAGFQEAVKQKSASVKEFNAMSTSKQRARAAESREEVVGEIVNDRDASGNTKRLVGSMVDKEFASVLVEYPALPADKAYEAAKDAVIKNTHEGIVGLTEEAANKGSLKFGDGTFKEKMLKGIARLFPDRKMREDYEVIYDDGMVIIYPYADNGEPMLNKPAAFPLSEIENMHRTSKDVLEADKKNRLNQEALKFQQEQAFKR